MVEAQQYPRGFIATGSQIVAVVFLIDTAGRDSGRSLGGVPDTGIVDQGTKNIRMKIAPIDSMAEHLKGCTGQLDYLDGAIGAVFLYSEVLYPPPVASRSINDLFQSSIM